jgi:oxaloacetate decarboxylase gamma subunit
MENQVYFGVMLMIIGMTTVFTILAFVVLGGKVTILLTNRFTAQRQSETPSVAQSIGDMNAAKIAAITAAVEQVTHGRGHITEIKKINQ